MSRPARRVFISSSRIFFSLYPVFASSFKKTYLGGSLRGPGPVPKTSVLVPKRNSVAFNHQRLGRFEIFRAISNLPESIVSMKKRVCKSTVDPSRGILVIIFEM